MHQFEDFEETLNRIVKHPEHHRQRREQFKVDYFEHSRKRLGLRSSFGLRTTPPPVQTLSAAD